MVVVVVVVVVQERLLLLLLLLLLRSLSTSYVGVSVCLCRKGTKQKILSFFSLALSFIFSACTSFREPLGFSSFPSLFYLFHLLLLLLLLLRCVSVEHIRV